MQRRSRMTIDPRHPYNAGTEHVGFPSTREAFIELQVSAGCRERGGGANGVCVVTKTTQTQRYGRTIACV